MRLFLETALALLISVGAIAGPASADTVTFRDGTPTPFLGGLYEGTEDAMVPTNDGIFEDQNFGARTNMEVGQVLPSYVRRDVLRFDVTALDGEFFSIDAVTLRLHVTDTDDLVPGDVKGTGTLELYRLAEANGSWVEGMETSAMLGAPPDTGQVTWAQRVQGSEAWAGSPGAGTPGVDYVDTILASAPFDAGTTAPGSAIDFVFGDVSFFPDWVAGANPGLFLRVQNEGFENAVSFGTRENGDSSLLPELIVEFSAVPEPAHVLQLLTGTLVLLGAGRSRRTLVRSSSA